MVSTQFTTKAGRIEEAAVLQRQGSVRPESHGGDAHAVFPLDRFERAERVALVGPLRGKLGAGDQVIDVRQTWSKP